MPTPPLGQPSQPGKINPLVMYQETFWWDVRGCRHTIAEIEPRYAAAIMGFLIRAAPALVEGLAAHALATWLSHDGGDMAHDSLEHAFHQLAEADNPAAEIRTTKLFQALRARAETYHQEEMANAHQC